MDISRYSNVGLLNAGTYSTQFINEDTNCMASSFTIKAKKINRDEANRIAALSGDSGLFDTAEEIALLSTTAGVINVRPVEAAEMLPASDPVLIDLQLGAMLYMKKAAVSFLGGGDPAKYAVELKFITDRGNVTEADIKNFMAQGIAETVNAEFNKIRFSMSNPTAYKYDVAMTHNPQTGYYKLSYKNTENITKEISAASLEALISVMSRNPAEFSQTSVNETRWEAALMPAVIFDDWKKTTPSMVNPYELLTRALTNFYITPNETDYRVIRGIHARAQLAAFTDGDGFTRNMRSSIEYTLFSLNQELNSKINGDINTTSKMIAAAGIPDEPQYGIFTLTKAAGDEIFVSKRNPASARQLTAGY
jgi:hypothetical protein